ncbi:MAG: 6-carboxytetrahydropterin synthase [Candidatus Marinimicrobia bacterium]|jgi:6-pyruvoyltetrahydropterin/6-carboxytetrahydropterin synthase|nr:6-carboxytetrahydropterin synthase [Candidatus Neomarinimicrobiota bacterium]MBT3633421.1 6-carboxytetrahydropterin synthase [Candidatus Neomarinimicrobiota bacterium]MBT3681564.1 6-carboxytetrahydropterin synthase [Candidatus Neomarinimicrobiota bacterium]MBT3758469.1 6-carboxytetrahydropterin synthase [Candidatus Neomarinimicrobiota bacterium]MBT3894877.1 6-carboxytetrahydropterin synthase [Candidatus Neomarinimicrobiota bacterium]
MKVVKIIQWDMGHRVLNHRSVCKGLHGHRYRAEICFEGDLISTKGQSEEGMVVDFGDIKKLAMERIHANLDHGFMVWDKDAELLDFFNESDGHKPIVVSFTPTAENVAKYIFDELDGRMKDIFGNGLTLVSIKLWETPSSFALYERENDSK